MSLRRHVLGVLLATLCGAIASQLGIPAGWLVGSMTGAMLWAAYGGFPGGVIQWPHTVALSIIGAGIVAPLSSSTSVTFGDALLSMGLMVLVLLTSVIVGLLVARYTNTDRRILVAGLLPGAAPAVIGMCDDLDIDVRPVAAIQFIRLVLVVVSAPFVALVLVDAFPHDRTVVAPSLHGGGSLSFSIVCIVVGWLLARWRSGSVSFLLFPITLVVIFVALGHDVALVPAPIFAAALATIGIWVGARFDGEAMRAVARPLLIGAVAGSIVILISMFMGVLLIGALAHEGPSTGILAGAPGAPEVMSAAAMDIEGNAQLVLLSQITRMIGAVVVLPVLLRRLD